jgi:ABC-type dipeptide/oligopeptide/nickel transport system permease component
MAAYTIRRLLGLIPVLLGISLLVFTVLRLIPADPALLILGERATPAQREALREQLGLNKPLFFNFTPERRNLFDGQYFNFMGDLLQGNFGTSIVRRTSIWTELTLRFPATLELTIAALSLAIAIGVPAGMLAAVRRGSAIDTLSVLLALIGVSIPIFWLGLLLQYLFAVNLGWLPVSQRISVEYTRTFQPITGMYVLDGLLRGRLDVAGDALRHLIMPAVALSTVPMAIIARMTRSAMLEVLNQDYIRTARAKGLSGPVVVTRHALRNALLPVVTVVGLQLGALLGGAILTETVFSWPGIGTWILEGVRGRDYPVVQSGVIFVAFWFVIINTVVDLSYALLDPRIQHR